MKVKFLLITLLFLGGVVTSGHPASQALRLNGEGDYVEVPDSDSLDFIDAITVEAWANPDAVGDDFHTVVAKGGNIGNGGTYHVSIANIGVWRFLVNDGVWHKVDAPTSPKEKVWVHVAMTFDRKTDTVKIYLNGELDITENSFKFTPLVDDRALQMGANNTAQFWVGLLDEIRIWNIVRSQAEIQQTMNTLLEGTERGLVGYWRFDENTEDGSSEKNHGELKGKAQLEAPGMDLKPAAVSPGGKLSTTWGYIKGKY